MYEYHGWITIRNTMGEDSENALLERIYRQIKERVDHYYWDVGLMDLRWINQYPHISLAGFNDLRSSYASDVFELYNDVAKIAPESYGVLYTRDSEAENRFRVFVLARGKLEEHEDPFLSPFVPRLDDTEG